jgi:hypothetical protein
MAHVEHTPAGFPDHGEGFHEEVVKSGALSELFFEFNGFGRQVDIGEGFEARFQGVDGLDERPHAFNFSLVFRAKNLSQDCINHTEVSFWGRAIHYPF